MDAPTIIVVGGDLRVRRWVDGSPALRRGDVGSSIAELFPPETREASLRVLRGALADGAVELDCRTAAGAVARCSWQMTSTSEATGDSATLVVVVRPSSVQRELADAHALMVEHISVGILVAQDGRIRFVNPETVRLLGHPLPALLTIPFIQFLHPEDRPLVLERHVKRLRGDAVPDSYAFRAVDARGGIRWLEIKALVATWQGQPATINFLQDVTFQKAVLAEKFDLEQQLHTSQRIESLGRLAAGVAHDVNNVLGAIMAYASRWQNELPEGHSMIPDVLDVLAACESGSGLTRNLLGFARQGTYTMEPVSLNEVARQTQRILERTLPKSIVIALDLDDDLPAIVGDSSQLSHAVMNLCINAADAMPDGGRLSIRTLRTDTRDGESVSPAADGAYVVLRVCDTGCEIPAETLKRAFEPFFTTKPKGLGTGLGLAMVAGTAQSHGGFVRLQSTNRGTTAMIVFPVADTTPQSATREPEPRESPGLVLSRTEHVLLVEDEPTVQRATSRLLQRLGCSVVPVESGECALEILAADRSQRITIVILDLMMPGIGGAETFRRLREMRPGLRVVVCSGYTHEPTVQGLLSAGAAGFLPKPYSLQQLADTLRSADGTPKGLP